MSFVHECEDIPLRKVCMEHGGHRWNVLDMFHLKCSFCNTYYIFDEEEHVFYAISERSKKIVDEFWDIIAGQHFDIVTGAKV